MNMYEIVPGLYVRGHLVRLQKRSLKRLLRRYRIDVVVSTVEPYMGSVDRMVGSYIWYPVRDDVLAKEQVRGLEKVAVQVSRSLQNGKRVLIHCNGGKNRSCFVAAMALMHHMRIRGRKAMKYIRRANPNALRSNKFFVKCLKKKACAK